jgi:hypothetical protein
MGAGNFENFENFEKFENIILKNKAFGNPRLLKPMVLEAYVAETLCFPMKYFQNFQNFGIAWPSPRAQSGQGRWSGNLGHFGIPWGIRRGWGH